MPTQLEEYKVKLDESLQLLQSKDTDMRKLLGEVEKTKEHLQVRLEYILFPKTGFVVRRVSAQKIPIPANLHQPYSWCIFDLLDY